MDEYGQEIPTPIFGAERPSGNIDLKAMTSEDLFEVEFDGEMGCAFSQSPAGEPLVLAYGWVGEDEDKADFAVKLNNRLERGDGEEEGGFDALLDGSTFSANGVLVEVAVVSREPAGSGAAPPLPAAMRASRPDGSQAIIRGFWTCGLWSLITRNRRPGNRPLQGR